MPLNLKTKYEQQIKELLDNDVTETQRVLEELRKFSSLYNDEELAKVQTFLSQSDKTFDDYKRHIAHYAKLADEILTGIECTSFTALFEITRKKFINMIMEHVHSLKSSLIRRITDDYQIEAER